MFTFLQRLIWKVRRRSLVVLKDQCYSSLLHGIQEVKEDQMDESIFNLAEEEKERGVMARDTRISLTIRHVPKTSKLKIRLWKIWGQPCNVCVCAQLQVISDTAAVVCCCDIGIMFVICLLINMHKCWSLLRNLPAFQNFSQLNRKLHLSVQDAPVPDFYTILPLNSPFHAAISQT